MPRGNFHAVAEGAYVEVFGASQVVTWSTDHRKVAYLSLDMASTMGGIGDTLTMWHESRLILPLAESLAAQNSDTVIQIEHVTYPLSRMLPLRMAVHTYYRRQRDSTWAPSADLWH